MKKNLEELKSPVPKCGSSEKRNQDYEHNFSPKNFFGHIVQNSQPIIFDVGAHKGESVRFFKEIFADASIYSFEPEPSNFAILHSIAEANDTFAFQLALSDCNGEGEFYRQDISHLGGLLPINTQSTDSLGYAKKAKNEVVLVETVTLDRFCKQHSVSHIDILKIDVQGFEASVLRGGKSVLLNTSCVMVEISLYDFYKLGQSSLLNVELIMSEAGFSLWDVSKVSKNPQNFRTDWVELVYTKTKQGI